MRKMFAATIAVAALASTVPASAFTVVYQPGDNVAGSAFNTPLPQGTTIENFDALPVGGVIYDDSEQNVAARPAFGSSGNFLAVGTGQSYTIDFAPAKMFSFILGSLDTYNTLQLFYDLNDNIADITLNGAQITQGLQADGNQVSSNTNGRVIYHAGAAPVSFVRAIFTSGQQAFEVDNIVTAVPEPATWGMMLLGFGAAGAMLRRRRTTVKFATA